MQANNLFGDATALNVLLDYKKPAKAVSENEWSLAIGYLAMKGIRLQQPVAYDH